MILLCSELIGIALSIVGLFLPWGVFSWPKDAMSLSRDYAFGFEVLTGSFALTGCLTIIVSLARNIRRKKMPRKGIFAGETVIAFFSLLWILDSRNLSWAWGRSGGPFSLSTFYPGYFLPIYGAYISCVGAIITLTSITIRHLLAPQINSNQLFV